MPVAPLAAERSTSPGRDGGATLFAHHTKVVIDEPVYRGNTKTWALAYVNCHGPGARYPER